MICITFWENGSIAVQKLNEGVEFELAPDDLWSEPLYPEDVEFLVKVVRDIYDEATGDVETG